MKVKAASVEEAYQKNKELRKEDVNSLVDWLHMQPHLPKLTGRLN